MPEPASAIVGNFLLGIVGNLVASYSDRQLGKLLDRRINADIQNALHMAWKNACSDILSTYRQSSEFKRLDKGERGQIEHWAKVLTNPSTLDLLFPQLDRGSSPTRSNDIADLDTADAVVVTRHLHRQLEAIPEWNDLLGGLQSALRNNLLGGLIFHFGEVIKRNPKARDGLFHQQLLEIRRTTGKTEAQFEELFDYLRDALGQREEVKQYRSEVLGKLESIDQTTQRTEQKVDELSKKIEQRFPKIVAPPLTIFGPDEGFIGRKQDISNISQALRTGPVDKPAIVLICGMGGVGKTQLARAVVQEIRSTFSGPQLLVSLQGTQSTPIEPIQALRSLLSSLEPTLQLPDNLEALKGLYHHRLKDTHAIIVVDDAYNPAQVRPLIPPPGCALIVTSRQQFSLSNVRPVNLAVLPQDEAETLLLQGCTRIRTDAAPRLAQLCGYLPLALRVSAAMLANDEGRGVEKYIQDLEDERLRLKRLKMVLDPELDVEASLNLSYQALTPELQSVLQQLSVFPASFDRLAASEIVEADDDVQDEMLDNLRVRSLLEQDVATQRYNLHDLIRTFTGGKLAASDGIDARLRYAQFYVEVAAFANNLYKQGHDNVQNGLAVFDLERTNIDTAWMWVRQQELGEMIALLLMYFVDSTAYVGSLRYDNRRERIPQLEAAMKATRYTGRQDAEGVCLGNLGVAYCSLGDAHQAITYHEQHLAIARTIGDRTGEGNALSGLGNAYSVLGDKHKAISFYEQHLIIARDIGDLHAEGHTLCNLGIAYHNLGNMHKAITYFEQALTIVRKIGDHHGEGEALSNLGNVYVVLGNIHKAITYHEQALTIMRKLGDRRGEGNILGNLGIAHHNLGNTHKATAYFEQAINIARTTGDRESEANASWNLGIELTKQGKFEGVADLLQICANYEREIDHPNAEKRSTVIQVLRQAINHREWSDGEGTSGDEHDQEE
jgi:tetratricopeptide (TPR) repeat protein